MKKNNFKLNNITLQGYKSISFKMMSYMMSKSFSKYVELNGTSNQLLHFDAKQTPVISAQLTFSSDEGNDIYHFNIENAMSDRLIIR